MKKKSSTYQLIRKFVAAFLLVGMLLPTGLQAQQLMDYCMADKSMSNHHMMDDSHDCCHTDESSHSEANKDHLCEGETVCACTPDTTPLNEKNGVPANTSSAVILPQTGFNFSVTSPDEILYKDYYASSLSASPPLYLLYDTFLN